ncbi:hypothetical protein [Streptomyces sp. NPDC046862]|uniref:hypothetical protein n=1 Tax=Streptomyces sp. NPDC046862 TaxID=3154603 RepID=UPI003455DCD0
MARLGLRPTDRTAYLIIFLTTIGLWGTIEYKVRSVDRRTARLERKVDLVLESLGVEYVDPALDEVDTLVREGKKIQAIKRYRIITGANLSEAKDAVERMEV